MTTSRRLVMGYFLLASIEALVGMIFQLFFARGFQGGFAGEISLFQLVLVFVLFCVSVALGFVLWRAWRNPLWAEGLWQKAFSSAQQIKRLLWIFGAAFSVLITILLIPPYRFGAFEIYAEQLHPFLGWGALVCAQTCLALLVWRTKTTEDSHRVAFPREVMYASGVFFLVLMILLVWVALTKTGVVATVQPWYPVGIPLLPGQVWVTGLLVIAASVAFWKWPLWTRLLRSGRAWNTDLFIGLGIWVLAATLWLTTPLPRSFFFPGPYPPDNIVYPYADSAVWDMGGQFALIGQGFDNSDPFQDHVGYMGILAFYHLLVGDDYARMSALQAGLLAIFPALMYWLGKSVHSRPAGLFVAGLTIFHEMNAFTASSMIDLSHARFLLTEYPTRVGLAVLALLLFRWLRAPQKGEAYALPIGGLLAFMVLLRFNMLAFPLAVVTGIMLVYGSQWKRGLRASLVTLLVLALTLAPWMWRSWSLSGTPLFFAEKSQKIFRERFRFNPPKDSSPSSFAPPLEMAQVDSDVMLTRLLDEVNFSKDSAFVVTENEQSVVGVILSRFMHNLVASTLILPTNLSFHDVQHTIYEVHPYWEKNDTVWQGNLTAQETILLIANLAFISIGLGASWRKWRLVGLVPLGICLAYTFALALARTSGGRYIVPVDWGVLFYWGVGIVQAAAWGAARLGVGVPEQGDPPAPATFSYKQGWLFLLPFLFFVGAMTVADRAVPERFSNLNKVEVVEMVKQSGALKQTEISNKDLTEFIRSKGALAYYGRGLYPRYYGMGQGESSGGVDAYEPENYPRLAFTLIGPFERKDVILPWVIQNPSRLRSTRFPNALDVIVIGCLRSLREEKSKSMYKDVVDALMIVILGDSPEIFLRNPSAPLECPIPEPVCEDNYNCLQ